MQSIRDAILLLAVILVVVSVRVTPSPDFGGFPTTAAAAPAQAALPEAAPPLGQSEATSTPGSAKTIEAAFCVRQRRQAGPDAEGLVTIEVHTAGTKVCPKDKDPRGKA